MRLTLDDVIQNARHAGGARRFPTEGDPRVRDGGIFSEVFPRFTLTKGSSVFTLGSCFARSVEEQLREFRLPTMSFAARATERPGRSNGILNEYNPGTMCQRIEHAARAESFGDSCIAAEGDGYVDLLLPEYVTPATKERLLERRAEVDRVYVAMSTCEAAIVALDAVEAWYDTAAGLYLNRIPVAPLLLAERERYEVHILDVDETQALLDRMVRALLDSGVRKILLTVSPIQLEATYSGTDCLMANSYSKAVLVASAHAMKRRHHEVDYFPGYEIVASAGAQFYEADSVHVRDAAIELVTSYLVTRYVA